MTCPRVVVIEPFEPHTFLAIRWAEALAAAGAHVSTVIWPDTQGRNLEVSPLHPWPLLPTVPVPAAISGGLGLLARAWVVWQYLVHAIRIRTVVRRALRLHRPTHILITTSFTTDLLGLAATPPSVRVIAFVHGQPIDSTMARFALRRFAGSSSGKAPRWITCFSEDMRVPFLQAGALSAKVVAAPAAWMTVDHAEADRTPDAPVMFAGEARREKGFDLFVEAIPRLLESGPVRLQTYNLTGVDDATRERIDRLARSADKRLTLIESRVSDEEYDRLLSTASMIVLPYDPAAYPYGRISGILSEAWAAGVPVVVSDGWWASPIVREHGGGAVFDYGDIDSLVRAIATVRSDPSGMRARARAGHDAMLAAQGPDAFARFVLAL